MAAEMETSVSNQPLVHGEQGMQPPALPDTSTTTTISDEKQVDEWRKRLLGFTLQLLQEFLATHALERTAEVLRHELETSPSSSLESDTSTASAALWFDMQHRCRTALNSKAGVGGKPTRESSTLEQLVAFVVELPPPRGGGRFALDVGASAASPLIVFASPKTSAFDGGVNVKKKRALQLGGVSTASFTLMDAYAQTRSPVTLPSQRRRQSQLQQASAASPSQETTTATETKAQALEPEAAPSEPNDHADGSESDEEESTTTDGNDEGPASSSASVTSISGESTAARSTKTASFAGQQQKNEASSSSPPKQRLQSRKKKRRPHHALHGQSHRSPLPSPAYPRSPWANAALHSNKHFVVGSIARVNADFDAAIRRGSEASTSAPSLLEPEPALVRALDATLQRDLCSVRLVDRELRHLRLEKVRSDCTGSICVSSDKDAYERAIVLEKFGSTKRVECALCAFPFLIYNLPHRVSFKCVMDVHDAWGYAPPDRATAAKYRPPLCYDAVRVCRLCAPIVLQYATKGSLDGGGLALSESRSVGSLPSHRRKPWSRGAALSSSSSSSTFCFDPYALPPLFADDFMDERDAFGHDRGHGSGYGAGVNGGGLNGLGGSNSVLLESPAKTIVYANQTDATAFMSAKEWEVINPHRSSIRQVMEKTVRAPSAISHEH